MSRLGAAFALSLLPGLAFCQNTGLSFLTKFAPGETVSARSFLGDIDVRRKTALLVTSAPEYWASPTYGQQYYLRSFEGLPLERIPIETIRPRFSPGGSSKIEVASLAGDGKAVVFQVYRPFSYLEPRDTYIYNRETKSFAAIPAALGLYPIEVVGGTTVIAKRNPYSVDRATVKLDLTTGVQTVLTNVPYDFATPDGKYLLTVAEVSGGGDYSEARLFNLANGRVRALRLTGRNRNIPYFFARDRRSIYYRHGTDISQAPVVKLDPFSAKETVFPLPESLSGYFGVEDVLGDKLVTGNGRTVWTLSTGEVTPFFNGNVSPFDQDASAQGVLLNASSGLLVLNNAVSFGFGEQISGFYTGRLGSSVWRPVVAPRIGTRTMKLAAVAPDDRTVISAFVPVANEGQGAKFGFVRKDLLTGTVRLLPGRETVPELMQLSDGGTTALFASGYPIKLSIRNMDSGVETPLDLGDRSPSDFTLAPSGTEAIIALRKTDLQPAALLRWTPAGLTSLPLPANMHEVDRVALAGGRLVLVGDGPPVVGSSTTGDWKPLATVDHAEVPAISRDGTTVSLMLNGLDSDRTRLYRGSDGKLLQTIPQPGQISSDGQWLMPLISSPGTIYYIPTGALADLLPGRSNESTIDFVGPWQLQTPTVFPSGSGIPVAYRASVLRAPEFTIESGYQIGPDGLVKINLRVTKAGLQNSAITSYLRSDGGEWRSFPSDRIETLLTHGAHDVEIYVQDAEGRRSASQFLKVLADAVPPVLTDLHHKISARVAYLYVTCTTDGNSLSVIDFALAKEGEEYRWLRSTSVSNGVFVKAYRDILPNVLYKYRARGTDSAGNVSYSEEKTLMIVD